MNTTDFKNTTVSYYRNFYDKCSFNISLFDCLVTIPEHFKEQYEQLRNIKDEAWQKEQKKKFPMFVPSAVCGTDENGHATRRKDCVISKNNIMVLDIDKQDNPNIPMNNLKNLLFKLDYVYAVSTSIRGNGLFVVIAVADINNIADHFRAIYREFLNVGIILDEKCKDITRARYCSYDPDILIKEDCDIVPYSNTEKEYNEATQRIIDNRDRYNNITYSSSELTKVMDILFDSGYCGTGDYNDWLHECYNLCALSAELGETYCLDKFIKFSQNTPGFKSLADVERQFYQVLKRSSSTFDDPMRYYCGKLKSLLGKDWRKKINKMC